MAMNNKIAKKPGRNLSEKKARPNPAAAPAADKADEITPKNAKKAGKKNSNEIRDQLASSAAPVDLENVENKSNTLAYVVALGDPSEVDRATFKKGNSEETRTFSRIIGYRFRALEAMEVPDFGTTDRFNGPRLNNAADVTNWKQVQAGEEFDLTRVEAGALLSQPQFNLRATGGDHAVRLQIAFARLKSTEFNDAEELPSMSLVLDGENSNGASIKDLGIVDVLDYERAEGQFTEGVRTIRDEFKGTKFENRALDKSQKSISRRTSGGGAKSKEQQHQQIAAAARGMFQSLAAKSAPKA